MITLTIESAYVERIVRQLLRVTLAYFRTVDILLYNIPEPIVEPVGKTKTVTEGICLDQPFSKWSIWTPLGSDRTFRGYALGRNETGGSWKVPGGP